jgi:hypothetical protein
MKTKKQPAKTEAPRLTPQQAAARYLERFDRLITDHIEKQQKVVTDAAAALVGTAAKGGVWAGDVMESRCEEVMLAGALLGMADWIKPIGQLPDGVTREDYRDLISQGIEQLTRDILRGDSYRHNCTRESTSIQNRMKFKALQETVLLLELLAFHLDAAAECEAWAAEGRAEVGESKYEMPSRW